MQKTLDAAKKIVIGLIGLGFLFLGLLSIIIPVLPGFVFLIVSAACFASISETARLKLRNWYHRHRLRHIPRDTYGLSTVEKIRLKFLQTGAEVLRWFK